MIFFCTFINDLYYFIYEGAEKGDEFTRPQVLNSLSMEDIHKMKEFSHRVAWKCSNHSNEKVMEKLLQDLTLISTPPAAESVTS